MMNIKNYKSSTVCENVDITIRNFHIHGEFQNHATMNKHLDHNWTKFIPNKKNEYYLLIDSQRKKKPTN